MYILAYIQSMKDRSYWAAGLALEIALVTGEITKEQYDCLQFHS